MNTRIVELIKKLIRHERSTRRGAGTSGMYGTSTAEEAAAFAAKIQQLCIEHKIAADQVNVDDEQPTTRIDEEVFSPYKKRWRGPGEYVTGEDSRLMAVVSTALFCQAIIIPRTNCVMIIGEDQDRAVCIEMFSYLRRSMRSAFTRHQALRRRQRRTIRKARYYFTLGFTRAIYDRYEETRAAADNTTTALVKADTMVRAYVSEKYETKSCTARQPQGRQNHEAYWAGQIHGREVSLATNVIGQAPVVNQLSGGQQ